MPIYEYSCDKCKKMFEEWTRHIDDNTVQTCPECGGTARRIVSNTSFVLKGGGWYVTEYGNRKGASDSGGSAEKSDSTASSDASAANSSDAASFGSPAKPESPPKAGSAKPVSAKTESTASGSAA